jgi:glycosyl transferase family 2
VGPEVSIVVVTHNAFIYCLRLFRSLSRTAGVRYEVVVVDNRSRLPTRLLLIALALGGRIKRLCMLHRNTLFAEGNNIGVDATSREAPLVLLLNSDVEVRDPMWLRNLVDAHQRGVTALGFVDEHPISRADGYCFLIDRDLYQNIRLDESHQWWWGMTKLQAAVLREGLPVRSVRDHDDLLVHFGGKSGRGHFKATGMDVSEAQVLEWLDGRQVESVPSIDALR